MVVVLTKDIKKRILKEPRLYADVCVALDIAPRTLGDYIHQDNPRLTQKNVLFAISSYTGISEDQLIKSDTKVQPALS